MRRKSSPRRKNENYYSGKFFVTFNTKHFSKDFGYIINGKMILNKYGEIAQEKIYWLEENFDNVKILEFIIMPDYVYILIFLKDEDDIIKRRPLSQVIGAYKTVSSKHIRLNGLKDFRWHRSFHDYRIKDQIAENNVIAYIKRNPASHELKKRRKKLSRSNLKYY